MQTEEKPAKKKEDLIKSEATQKSAKQSFYYGTGRRKTAIARVRLSSGKGEILVNEKPVKEVFNEVVNLKTIYHPLELVDRVNTFTASIKLAGGGIQAQADAIALGLSRALVSYDEALREKLAKDGMLTRDPRMKERRKYGLGGKARKGKQSPKR